MAQPTKQVIPSRYSVTPIKFAFTAGVTSAGQATTWTAGDVLIAHNSHETDPFTVQMVSNPKYKRGADTVAAFSLAAGEYCVLPRFPAQDDDDPITVIVENVAVKIARLGTAADPS
jgi:hypothetical protein